MGDETEQAPRVRDFNLLIAGAHARLVELNSIRRQQTVALFNAGPDQDLLEHAWRIYTGALTTAITGGQDWKNLQIITIPSQVQWDDPDFGSYYFHKVTADLINQNGSTYAKSDRSFAERYGYFLTDVKRKPIDTEALEKSRGMLKRARDEEITHIALEDTISAEWRAHDDRQRQAYPNQPARWDTIDAWYQKTRSDETLNASMQIVLGYYGQYYYLIQKAYGGAETLVKMLDKWTNAVPLRVKVPRLNSTQADGFTDVYPYQISFDFPSWLADARKNLHQKVRFTIRHDSYQEDYSHTEMAGGIGIGFGFFGIIAAGQRSTVQIDTRREGFELNFEADIKTFEILPGAWYDTSAFEIFHNGEFYPDSPMDNLLKQGRLWGPTGYLNFRPMRAIVAYKPIVSIKLRYDEYHYFYQVTRGAAAFCLGPWVIGGASYYNEERHVRWDHDELTVTIYDGPDLAQLLAFDSIALG
jgi:hypothetical protein